MYYIIYFYKQTKIPKKKKKMINHFKRDFDDINLIFLNF